MNSLIDTQPTAKPKFSRIKIAAIVMSIFGMAVFCYFVYAVGVREIVDGISRFGFVGFAVILTIYFLRICARSYAWKLCVQSPDKLEIYDTVPATLIGEALSSTLPLGILISGTSKAIAVRERVRFVVGLSSVATENLYYSFITGIFLMLGAMFLLRGFAVDEGVRYTLNLMIGTLVVATILGLLMVIRQWHFASWICNWVYDRGFLTKILEKGRGQVRRFEDLIYGFYRNYPQRFIPICLLQAAYHCLGVAEVWFTLNRVGEAIPTLQTAFLLESVSRLVTILFKLIPFNIGVDEAGAEFVGTAIALTAGLGVTLAIIRKGRILFWTAIGWLLILKRGMTVKDLSNKPQVAQTSA